jgi:hypothetical protein
MTRLLFVGLSTFALLGAVEPSSASADHYCLQGPHWGYPGNCQFSSYKQCMASASGTHAHCGVNPHYAHHRRAQGH